jgi:phosphate transport system permease protein
MSDLLDLEEPKDTGHDMRDEIRRTSERVRARRVATSRVMVVLCSAALLLAAVPLVLLMYQLFKQGVGQLGHWKFFSTLPTTPTIVAPNATGGISNDIIGTIALTIYASIVAIPLGVIVGVYLAETDSTWRSRPPS